MITLFTAPKPFHSETDVRQRHAIRSWTLLGADCHVILFGNEAGTAEAARDCRVTHAAEIRRNEYGTPLVSSLFEQARRLSADPFLCYVNADIILMPDFVRAIESVAARWDRFLIVGRRSDVEVPQSFRFDDGWETTLRAMVAAGDQPFVGIDYFVFPRDLWGTIPPLAVGRAWWDNWPIFEARRRRAVVVDVTMVVTAVHQSHDYSHLAGGKRQAYDGPEAARNRGLLGGLHQAFATAEATHLLTPCGLRWRCRSCYPVCCCDPNEENHASCDLR